MVRPKMEREQEAGRGNFLGLLATGLRAGTPPRQAQGKALGKPARSWRYYNDGAMRTADFTIREFRREDFDLLWEIDQKCFPPGISYSQVELLAYMRRPRSFTLVAEGAGNDPISGKEAGPMGFIVAEAGRTRGHIITIDVLDPVRRSGLGTKLLTSAEERLRGMGCTSVLLETAVDNESALAFYKRKGYFLVKTVPRYYSTGVDAFVLKKDLLSPASAS